MLEIIIFFVFVWLMLLVLQVFGMIVGSLTAEKHEKERCAIAQVKRMGNSSTTNEPTPRGVKVFYWGAGLFYATVLASHLAGYP